MVHGIMEIALGDEQAAFRRQKSTQLTSSMKDICSNITQRDYTDTLKRCYHGFGHFVMNLTNQDVLKALPLCDQISDTKYITDCYTGALMQNFDPSSQDDHKAIYFSAGPPHAFCANLEERYRGVCYRYAVLTSSMADSNESIARCMRVPSEYIEGCIGNYGANRVAFTRDLQELKRLCEKVPPGLFLQCVVPLATQIGKNSFSEPERVELFCNQLLQEKQDTCVRSGIYGLLSTLKKDSEVPHNIANICKRHEVECNINKL